MSKALVERQFSRFIAGIVNRAARLLLSVAGLDWRMFALDHDTVVLKFVSNTLRAGVALSVAESSYALCSSSGRSTPEKSAKQALFTLTGSAKTLNIQSLKPRFGTAHHRRVAFTADLLFRGMYV